MDIFDPKIVILVIFWPVKFEFTGTLTKYFLTKKSSKLLAQ